MSRENHIYEPDWSGRTDQLCSVNKPVIKKDALALVTGKPVYVDDLAPKDCLIVKVLRSPHANAIVKSVKKTAAERVPGIEAIYTWRMCRNSVLQWQDRPTRNQARMTV